MYKLHKAIGQKIHRLNGCEYFNGDPQKLNVPTVEKIAHQYDI